MLKEKKRGFLTFFHEMPLAHIQSLKCSQKNINSSLHHPKTLTEHNKTFYRASSYNTFECSNPYFKLAPVRLPRRQPLQPKSRSNKGLDKRLLLVAIAELNNLVTNPSDHWQKKNSPRKLYPPGPGNKAKNNNRDEKNKEQKGCSATGMESAELLYIFYGQWFSCFITIDCLVFRAMILKQPSDIIHP